MGNESGEGIARSTKCRLAGRDSYATNRPSTEPLSSTWQFYGWVPSHVSLPAGTRQSTRQ
jgi:hypothetical protein